MPGGLGLRRTPHALAVSASILLATLAALDCGASAADLHERMAAEQGDPRAQRRMGELYYNGPGVTRDRARAFEWFLRAAQQGDAVAQFQIGYMYDTGEGIAPSPAQAQNGIARRPNREKPRRSSISA